MRCRQLTPFVFALVFGTTNTLECASPRLEQLSSPAFYSLVQSTETDPCDHYFVAVDASGTKTRIAVFRNGLECIWEGTFSSIQFNQLEDILGAFLEDYHGPVHAVGLGLAGLVIGQDPGSQYCELTNRPGWKVVDSKRIAEVFKLEPSKVLFMSDLKATGFGIKCLPEDQIIILNEGIARKEPQSIVAPGTGLGIAALHWESNQYVPYPSEGGHVNFAPWDERGITLLRYLQKKTQSSYVPIERALSGSGICLLYQCLVECLHFKGSEKIIDLIQQQESGSIEMSQVVKAIVDDALINKNPTALEALEWFVVLLGNIASSTTLNFCSTGGCYIAGGIPARLNVFFEQSKALFMEAFIAKGFHGQILASVPVKLVKNPDTAVIGAGYAIIRLYLDQRIEN